MSSKVVEKLDRYTDCKLKVQKMWSMRVFVVPVVIGSLGSIPICLKKNLQLLSIYYAVSYPSYKKVYC